MTPAKATQEANGAIKRLAITFSCFRLHEELVDSIMDKAFHAAMRAHQADRPAEQPAMIAMHGRPCPPLECLRRWCTRRWERRSSVVSATHAGSLASPTAHRMHSTVVVSRPKEGEEEPNANAEGDGGSLFSR